MSSVAQDDFEFSYSNGHFKLILSESCFWFEL